MDNKLKTVLFYLVIAALFTPFLVNIHSYFPFIVTKATVFRLIVEAMLVCWVLWLVSKKRSHITLSPLAKAVIIYGVILLISAFFGVDTHFSLFSGNERADGVLGLAHFILFFLIIATAFDWKEIEKVLKAQLGIGVLYSFIALLAYSGVGAITSRFTSDRLAGYTGNPSFFATYLIFNAFLALYFYFRQFQEDNKIFNWWLLPFAFQSVLIFVTATRGGMLGYFAALLLVGGGIVLGLKDKQYQLLRRLTVAILLIGVVFAGLTYSLRDTSFVQNNIGLKRFTSISLKSPTAVSRILSAGTAWRSFLQKPLIGWGPENYEAAYVTNFNPKVIEYLPGDFYFDRAHNKPMEVLATTGILGFLSYLSIFGIALYSLNKLRKKKEWFLPSLALGGLLVGYFVQNIFLFDFHESYLMFYLSLAFISSVAFEEKTISSSLPGRKDYSQELGKYFLIVGTICLVLFTSTQWVIKPYQVSRNIFYFTYSLGTKQGDQAYGYLKKAFNENSFWEKDVILGADNAYSAYSSQIDDASKRKIIELLITKGSPYLEDSIVNYKLLLAIGDLNTISAQWEEGRMKEAQKIAQRILVLTPDFPNSHLFAAKVFLLNAETEKAIEEANKVIEIIPNQGTAYYILAVAYGNLDGLEQYKINLVKAAEFDFPFKDKKQILNVINFLAGEKKYSVIEKMYLQAIALDPQDPSLYSGLAATYGKLHNKEKAIEYAQKSAQIDSNYQQPSETFIQWIENEEWDKIGG